MSDFRLHILGCGSALPTVRHLPTAQILEIRGKLYLIDCGEGTQRQIRKQSLSFEAITAVFLTHLHGDHIFGLPGLISSLSMLGRTRALSITGPRGTEEVVGGMIRLLCDWITFEITIHEYDDRKPQIVWEDRSVSVRSVTLEHRLPCQGYVFTEKCAERHINKASCDFYQIPLKAYPSLLRGEDYTDDEGNTITCSLLTRPGRKPRQYAICTDTIYLPRLADELRGITLLYHEATFVQGEEARARKTYHSTASQAAMIARDAGVERLVIGHYSARYNDTKLFLDEAEAIFPNTIAADEGMIISL